MSLAIGVKIGKMKGERGSFCKEIYYFNGMDLNSQVADGLDKDWGDVNESCLKSAISNITTGAYRVASTSGETIRIQSVNDLLAAPEFKGAVDIRKKK